MEFRKKRYSVHHNTRNLLWKFLRSDCKSWFKNAWDKQWKNDFKDNISSRIGKYGPITDKFACRKIGKEETKRINSTNKIAKINAHFEIITKHSK